MKLFLNMNLLQL